MIEETKIIDAKDIKDYKLTYQNLKKAGKGEELKNFATKVFNTELDRLVKLMQVNEYALREQDGLVDALVDGGSRDDRILKDMAKKLEELNQLLIEQEAKKEELSKALQRKKEKLGGVTEPIRKFNEERVDIQKKLDQKTLDRCISTVQKGGPQIAFIMKELCGILSNTGTEATMEDVMWYMKNYKNITQALNRIDYSV